MLTAYEAGRWLRRRIASRESPVSARKLALIAFALGALYALTFLPPSYIAGRGVYWMQPFGDRMNNMIGALFYAKDEWRFPLFLVPKLSFPEGANIIFTDSLPLLALVFKAVYKVTGHWFNYFGLWVFACFPLLALFAALGTREAGARETTAQLGAALLAIASPALLLRIGHTALMGHFLIVWSILLYYRLHNEPGDWKTIAQYCAAAVLSVLLQAYFLIMVVPFLVAALAQALVEKRMTVLRAASSLGLVLAVTGATAWIAGIVGPGGAPATQWGFGHYSMNLVSPILPPRAHLPEWMSGVAKWEGGGLTWNATGGQVEGYNYLGAGVLLLLLVHAVASRRLALPALKRHAFLVAVSLFYFAFALSNRVFVGDWLAVEFAVPAPLMPLIGHFRTGGRLFWPVYYVLVVALVVASFRRFSWRVAIALVVAAVVLQLADTQFLRTRITNLAREGYPQRLPAERWTALLESHDYVKQYPSYQCGAWTPEWPAKNTNLELLWLAAKLDKPINSAYLARLNRDCGKELAEGLRFEVEPGGLYVYGGTFPIDKLQARPEFAQWCRDFEYGVICSRNRGSKEMTAQPAQAQPAPPATAGPDVAPMIQLGTPLRFSAGGNGTALLGSGWSVREGWGVWTLGPASEIALRLPSGPARDVRLAVTGYAFVHAKRLTQEIAVFAGDRRLATWTYAAGDRAKTFTVDVPRGLFDATGSIRLRLVPRNVESPEAAGVSDDRRAIGFALMEMTVSPAP